MATSSAENVLEELKKGIYRAIYFIQGEEVYYIDKITAYIEDRLLSPAERSFNLTIFYGKECNMAALLTQARRFPMGADKQVVLVKEAQEMSDLKNSTGQQLLSHYLKRPQPTTLLVFAYKYKNIDARTSFGKLLAEKNILITCNKLYERQIPHFIKSFVASLELSITEEAVWMLQAYIDQDLSKIAHALEKVKINLNPGDEITPHIVQEYIGLHKSFDIFGLQHAVMQKDYTKSYALIGQATFQTKETSAFAIVTILYNFFSKLLLLHETKIILPAKAAQEIKVHPYFVQGYLEACQTYSLMETLQNLIFLHEADLQLKGIASNNTDAQIIKELVFKLMHH